MIAVIRKILFFLNHKKVDSYVFDDKLHTIPVIYQENLKVSSIVKYIRISDRI